MMGTPGGESRWGLQGCAVTCVRGQAVSSKYLVLEETAAQQIHLFRKDP